jgi:hypothetical protein
MVGLETIFLIANAQYILHLVAFFFSSNSAKCPTLFSLTSLTDVNSSRSLLTPDGENDDVDGEPARKQADESAGDPEGRPRFLGVIFDIIRLSAT